MAERDGSTQRVRLLIIALLASSVLSCKPQPASRSGTPPPPKQPIVNADASSKASPAPRSTAPPPAQIWKEFSGENALTEAGKQIAIGARPSGSKEIEIARTHILKTLGDHGWDVERQQFTEDTPRGPLTFVNIVARFSATRARPAPLTTQRAIVCSHYDTKRFSTIQFVGANDGASSTGALLELARVLALDPPLAAQVELVFFDGEEAVAQFTETDGLYGSRHYARTLRENNRVGPFKFGILWDMIGDKDLTITLPPDSPQPLAQELLSAAETLGIRSHFAYYNRSIWDDHIPLNQAGIPTINLIDFDYLPWHTADDTLDKLSADSLQKIGALTLYYLHTTLTR